ncbi:MAG: DUF6489 family protein [Gammaproteobacteria bacterium]
MKINVELDLTPEELRTLLGLPEVKPLQDRLLQQVAEQLRSGAEGLDPLSLMKPFLAPPAGALDAVQRAFWQGLASATGAVTNPPKTDESQGGDEK